MNIKNKTLAIFLSLITIGPVFADTPPCPALSGFHISGIDKSFGPWTAYLDGSQGPFTGGLIKTDADSADKAKTIAQYAQQMVSPSGNARKVFWSDGSWFWACSSLTGNYQLISGTTRLFVSSKDYHGSMLKSSTQHSIKEQYMQSLK